MQAISKAAESAGQKAPVTANKSLTTTQDFHTSLGDSMRQRAARDQELMDSFNYKYNKGQRVFTEDSAQRNLPPMTVLGRVLEGNKMMREDPNDILSKRIMDELTGKPKRTPPEPGYKVRLEHSPENWSEFSIPESAIKGAVDKANGGAMRSPAKKTQGFVEGTSYGKSFKDRLRQAAPLSPLGVGLNAGYAGYKYLTGEDPLEDLRRKLDAKINPDTDTGSESDQQFEKLRKGGAIRMQVGGLSALANAGKAGTLANRLSRSESAGMRARQFADPLNPDDIMRMSEALGYAGAEGKTLNLTQADRSRVFGPNKGGTGFSGLQLTSPEHKKAKSTWGVGKPSHLTRLTKATDDDTIWSTFIGSPTQHMSNPVTTQRMYEAHKKGNPSAKLVEDMNKMLNKAVDDKTGKPMFPNGIDISDPSSLNQAQTFNQRKLLAKAMVMGGEKKGEKATQEAFRIIKEETDPLLMESPTYAIGNRLFTIDKNSGLYRPDLNSAFPYITTGDDLGLLFEPAPLKLAAPQFVNQEKYLNRLDKRGKPSPISHKDLSSTTPKQFISEEYLTNLQKEGYKDGGSAEPKPFHDFDQIMKRKDGGTVNQSFEQRLKSALNMAMGGEVSDNTTPDMTDSGRINYGGMYAGGGTTRRYAEAGSVPAPTPQELEKMADAQGAAFGVFPQMASKRFQQTSPTMDKASEMLKAQVTKEWEQAGRPGGMKELSLRIGAVLAGQVPDFVNFGQSMIPGLNKPASVLDPQGEKVAKFPMSGTSTDIKTSMREKGIINEDEYPLAELAGVFGAPYAAVKAPRAIEGGLNAVTAAARRPFTPATLTTEAVSPDLAKFKNPAFQDYATKQMIGEGSAVPMTTMGGRKTSQTRGQGVYLNEAGELEKNPMVGVNIPRAGNLSTNKALRADIATAGQELGQEAMAAHRFVPMATNQIKDASAMMIRGQGGRPLTSKEVMAMANELPDMIVTHSPANGGLMIAPFGMTKGQIPEEFLSAQSVARKVLGKDASIQFGKADEKKDLMYMMRNQYAEEGGRGTTPSAQDIRNKLKRMDKNFPLARQ